jgi:hypothetical protein
LLAGDEATLEEGSFCFDEIYEARNDFVVDFCAEFRSKELLGDPEDD